MMDRSKLIEALDEIKEESDVECYIHETFGFYIGSDGYGGHYEYRMYETEELADLIIEKLNKPIMSKERKQQIVDKPLLESEFTEEGFTELRSQFSIKGSGPLLMKRIIVQLLDYIADLQGWSIK